MTNLHFNKVTIFLKVVIEETSASGIFGNKTEETMEENVENLLKVLMGKAL